jgi:hypothetical protein
MPVDELGVQVEQVVLALHHERVGLSAFRLAHEMTCTLVRVGIISSA